MSPSSSSLIAYQHYRHYDGQADFTVHTRIAHPLLPLRIPLPHTSSHQNREKVSQFVHQAANRRPSIRWNSSTPTTARSKPTALPPVLKPESQPPPQPPRSAKATTPPTPSTPGSAAPTSLLSRLTSTLSLSPVEQSSKGESGSSSVRKLVELAKPERRDLGIAVGLVSFGLDFEWAGGMGNGL